MDYIKIAEGLTSLWPKKVKVILTEAATGNKIGEFKISGETLPDKFNKPMILEVAGIKWRVIEAEIVREASYLFTTKIRLVVDDLSSFTFKNRFEMPSHPAAWPQAINEAGDGEVITISRNNYRQLEFFPTGMIEDVKKEIEMIEIILAPEESINHLLGFRNVHLRNVTFDHCLHIDYFSFIDAVQHDGIFSLVLNDQLISNGFALRTFNYTYYGIREGDLIRELSITAFDSADDEFTNVLSWYGLMLVDWCNAKSYMSPSDDAKEEEIIKL